MEKQEVGVITHYFAKVGVAMIAATDGPISVGDKIHIKGHTTDVQLTVASMQIDRAGVAEAGPGRVIGIKVPDRVRSGDVVYKVTE